MDFEKKGRFVDRQREKGPGVGLLVERWRTGRRPIDLFIVLPKKISEGVHIVLIPYFHIQLLQSLQRCFPMVFSNGVGFLVTSLSVVAGGT